MKASAMERLAIQHWEYIRSLLDQTLPDDMTYSKAEHIEAIGFHYRTALKHGIKHGIQWAKERRSH